MLSFGSQKERQNDPLDNRPKLPVSISGNSYIALLDSGAERSFINFELVKKMKNIKIEKSNDNSVGITGKHVESHGFIVINMKLPCLAPSVSYSLILYITKMKHQILLGFDSIKSLGLIVNPTLETISWNKNNYSYATTAVGVPELESEVRFEILESSNFTSEAVDFAVDRSVLDM